MNAEMRILSDGVRRPYSADELHQRVVELEQKEAATPKCPRILTDEQIRQHDLEDALRPFAQFGARLLDGRRQVPKSGPWHGLDSGAPTEANITIEHFQRAMQVLHMEPAQRRKPA